MFSFTIQSQQALCRQSENVEFRKIIDNNNRSNERYISELNEMPLRRRIKDDSKYQTKVVLRLRSCMWH